MTHPSSIDLEAFAVGEPLPSAAASHVEECADCTAFVEELRALTSTGPTQREAAAAVARAAPPEPKRRLWLVATSVVTPLAAAAAILLLARRPLPPDRVIPAEPAMATTSHAEPASEPDTRFKGGLQVAVVRERGGEQARFSGAVKVRPGDRIRVEVALDREQAILGAVLADDGSYLELMPDAVRGAGTHFSEKSAKIDASPTRGTILIGSPEAVARARATRRMDDVATVRVEWESP